MEEPVPVNAQSRSASGKGYKDAGLSDSFPSAASRIAPMGQQRTELKAQLSCVALCFAAFILVAAYVLVPLALAVHSALHVGVLACGIAAGVLIGLFLLVAVIIMKTEGRKSGNAATNVVP